MARRRSARRRGQGPTRPAPPPDRDEQRIRLMPDSCAFPLWRYGMVSPEDLPLSDDLVEALQAWAGTYDELPRWGFEWPSEKVHDEFVAEGFRLWRWLQAELGPDWTVEYPDTLA